MNTQKNKSTINQFIIDDFSYLMAVDKVKYEMKIKDMNNIEKIKIVNLKTSYLINIIHDFLIHYFFNNDLKYELWSIILKKKYGENYNFYIDYLISHNFITLISNYYLGKKTKTYKMIDISTKKIIRCKISDTVLVKKFSKDFIYKNFVETCNSPIDIELRKILIDDLYHIEIDFEKSIDFIKNSYDKGKIDKNKFYKNMYSIQAIKQNNLFFKFDNYGRMHTNFTILKKQIRQNYLKIDGLEIEEIDIKNSQPFFFMLLLKKEIGVENFNDECFKFLELVNNGLIYDDMMEKLKMEERDDVKQLMFRVLFGNNKERCPENKNFKKLYPTIFEYIKEIKKDDYKILSKKLQNMESDFIFGRIIKDIKNLYPHITLFTVHDSIVFPKKYKDEVSLIFNNHMKNFK
jgi:hypothetical protein